MIELDPVADERGFFARSWCRRELAEHGLTSVVEQCNISYNHKAGTLRGMHYQSSPYAEAKVIRCIRGSAFDVIIDLREESPTFKRWFGTELTAENRRAVFVPEGFAHGFETLEDGTELLYQMSERYHPEAARGVRWDDPAFGVRWPLAPTAMSNQDRQYPDFEAP